MDGPQFDRLAREWATRRTAIGGLVVGLAGLVGLEAGASGRGKRKPGRKGKRRGDGAGDGKPRQQALHVEKKKKKKKKCKGGAIKCGKVCVTASTDALNCGGCGNRCGSGQACVAGTCTSTGPVECPGGQARCNGGCVDTTNDEAHCGGCNQACQGDLTCLNGVCACAGSGDVQCGIDCANLQTDEAHCGGCNQPCGAGKQCQGGQCVTQVCGANEILCNGECVTSSGAHPCCSQFDCGEPGEYNHIYCDTTQHQCRCNNSNYGICSRTPDRRGLCDECCAGGIGQLNCQGEMGCNGLNFCTCPVGTRKCYGGSDYRCYQHPPNPDGTLNDPTTCSSQSANSCVDCTEGGTKPYVCCWGGTCVDAAGNNPGAGSGMGGFCGGCERCEPHEMCCKNTSGGPSCKTPVGAGVCPLLSGG